VFGIYNTEKNLQQAISIKESLVPVSLTSLLQTELTWQDLLKKWSDNSLLHSFCCLKTHDQNLTYLKIPLTEEYAARV
jgi:hypothetical protein